MKEIPGIIICAFLFGILTGVVVCYQFFPHKNPAIIRTTCGTPDFSCAQAIEKISQEKAKIVSERHKLLCERTGGIYKYALVSKNATRLDGPNTEHCKNPTGIYEWSDEKDAFIKEEKLK